MKGEDHYGDKANMSLMRELLKTKEDRFEVEKGKDNKAQEIMPNEDDKTAGSPISTGPGPVKGNPHPATLQGFKQ